MTRKNLVSVAVNSVLEFIPKFLIINTFQDIVVDEQDFTWELNNFFQKTSLLSLNVCHDQALFIDSKKLKFSTVHILVLLRCQLKF